MDIEEFYDGDPRRRPSAEIELGTNWHDVHGTRYELNWIEDTGELYVMREPTPHITQGPFGGQRYTIRDSEEHKMTVTVVANVADLDTVHQILNGWQDAEMVDSGAEWLAERLRAAGVLIGSDDPIEDDDFGVDSTEQ